MGEAYSKDKSKKHVLDNLTDEEIENLNFVLENTKRGLYDEKRKVLKSENNLPFNIKNDFSPVKGYVYYHFSLLKKYHQDLVELQIMFPIATDRLNRFYYDSNNNNFLLSFETILNIKQEKIKFNNKIFYPNIKWFNDKNEANLVREKAINLIFLNNLLN